ncbi:hypothetical protein DP49_5986 [Burkholderia pseudomallei]|nr:hypothetical protein DP49_5986 [Burkholderia pseudomallei]
MHPFLLNPFAACAARSPQAERARRRPRSRAVTGAARALTPARCRARRRPARERAAPLLYGLRPPGSNRFQNRFQNVPGYAPPSSSQFCPVM